MPSLSNIDRRFQVPLTVVEGGSGIVYGVLTEADQKQLPVNVFINPRHVLRTKVQTAIKAGMVLKTASGSHYIVGYNGPSEQAQGTIWQSWRLFEATKQIEWRRRRKVVDPITKLERDDGYEPMGTIWAAFEMLSRQLTDYRAVENFEQTQIIVGQPVKLDDILDNRKVTRMVPTMGVQVGAIT